MLVNDLKLLEISILVVNKLGLFSAKPSLSAINSALPLAGIQTCLMTVKSKSGRIQPDSAAKIFLYDSCSDHIL